MIHGCFVETCDINAEGEMLKIQVPHVPPSLFFCQAAAARCTGEFVMCSLSSRHFRAGGSSASCLSLCLFQFDKWVALGTSDSIFKLTICNQFSKEGRGRGTRWKTWGWKMEMKPCLFWQRGTIWESSSADHLKGQFTQKGLHYFTLPSWLSFFCRI